MSCSVLTRNVTEVLELCPACVTLGIPKFEASENFYFLIIILFYGNISVDQKLKNPAFLESWLQ
jgi:myosin heavy subunit